MTTTTPHRSEPGSVAVKAAILDSATRLFAENGFAMTGVRDIAADAGVNPAIVIRHFGSKEELFIRTVNLPESWTSILDGPLDQIGERIVRLFAESRASKKKGHGAYPALLRASDRAEVQRTLRASTERTFVAPIVARLEGPDAVSRAHLFSAQIVGLMTALWVIEDPVVLAMDGDTLTRIYGSALQSTLTG